MSSSLMSRSESPRHSIGFFVHLAPYRLAYQILYAAPLVTSFFRGIQGNRVRHPNALDELSMVCNGQFLGPQCQSGHRQFIIVAFDGVLHAFDCLPGLVEEPFSLCFSED